MLAQGYALALRVIADGGATWHEVSARIGVGRVGTQAIVNGLLRQGVMHVCGWRQVPCGRRRQWTAVYELGPGEDAPAPVYLRPSNAITPAEVRGFCDLVKALQFDSWHGKGLAQYLGQSERTVRKTLRTMHALRLIYIDDYMHRACAGSRPPLFAWGPGQRDAPKPRRRTAREVWTYHNAMRTQRRAAAATLHAIVRGVSIDGRSRSSRLHAAQTQPELQGAV